jgi:hypothetical protein
MYSPEFSNFKDRQILVSSDRVTLYSKKDSIFLFGTQAVSLSSKKTINLDSVEKVVIFSPKIELGEKAVHPLVYGDQLVKILELFLAQIKFASNKLHNVSGGDNDIKASMEKIKSAGQIMHGASVDLTNRLQNVLSKTTFTA